MIFLFTLMCGATVIGHSLLHKNNYYKLMKTIFPDLSQQT